jgi:hypothetical protein
MRRFSTDGSGLSYRQARDVALRQAQYFIKRPFGEVAGLAERPPAGQGGAVIITKDSDFLLGLSLRRIVRAFGAQDLQMMIVKLTFHTFSRDTR